MNLPDQVQFSERVFKYCAWLGVAVIIVAILAAKRSEGASVVTEEFLNRVAWIESRNNPNAVGKAGERSELQLTPGAVRHVNETWDWNKSFHAATRYHARAYARAYLIICERALVKRLKRQPTQAEVYRAYNRGPYRK